MGNDSTQHPRAFVIMPFDDDFNKIYDSFISVSLIEAGYDVFRADDIHSQQNILKDIVESIVKSDLIVADLTGSNPNVFYEVGLAHAFQKDAILITQEIDDLPFDLRSYRIISYNTQFYEINKAKIELIKLAVGARNKEVPFGSPVTDFMSGLSDKTIIQEEKAVKSTAGEAGLLDYLVDMEDGFEKLTETVSCVALEMETISKATTLETERLKKLSESGGSARTKRVVIINLAQHYSRFAEKLSRYNDDYNSSLSSTSTGLEFVIRAQKPTNDDEKRQLNAFIDQMDITKQNIQEAKVGIDSLIEITKALPRVERTFSIAADNSVRQLEKYSQNLDQSISMVVRARQLAKEKLSE
jgi:hypothetical protein